MNALQRSSVIVLAVAGTLVAGRQALPPPSVQNVAAAKQQGVSNLRPSPNQESVPSDGPWNASRKFFGGKQSYSCDGLADVEKELGPDPEILALDPRYWCLGASSNAKVDAVIATVTDPKRTRLSLAFDRSVEAIQLAAQARNFTFDSYWLPWASGSGSEVTEASSTTQGRMARGTEAEACCELRDKERIRREFKEKQPGLMIFRAPPDETDNQANAPSKSAKLLLIFLVGETPTSGINGEQFLRAVNYVDRLRERSDTKPKSAKTSTSSNGSKACQGRPIQVIGPYYSGSLNSLTRLISIASTMRGCTLPFVVTSGTVSSYSAMKNEGLLDSAERPPNLTFYTTVHTSDIAVRAFLQDLKKEKHISRGNEVAILSEAGTVYGSTRYGSTLYGDKVSASDQGTKSSDHSTDIDKDSPLSFSYPRNISALRNAYKTTIDPTPKGDATEDLARRFLNLDLRDAQESDDDVPDFSVNQGPGAKEAVLMALVSDLRRRGTRYVGITASNVLDAIFLASYLRRALPDSRLFFLSSDFLFERQPRPFVGMAFLSTYPLLSDKVDPYLRKWWSFQDQFQAGLFYATAFSIQSKSARGSSANALCEVEPGRQTDRSRPSSPAAGNHAPSGLNASEEGNSLTLEYTAPFGGSFPRLWLTAAGRDGFWPVKAFDLGSWREREPWLQLSDDPQQGHAVPEDFRLHPAQFGVAWATVLVVIWAIAIIHFTAILTAPPVGSKLSDLSIFGPEPLQRATYLSLGSATIACALGLLIMPVLMHGNPWGWDSSLAPNGLPLWISLLIVLSLIVESAQLFRVCRELHERNNQRDRDKANENHDSKLILRSDDGDSNQRAKTPEFPAGMSVALVWLCFLIILVVWGFILRPDTSLYGYFAAYRSTHLLSAVSPLAPLLCLLAVIYLWAITRIYRLRFCDSWRPRINRFDSETIKKLRPIWLISEASYKGLLDAIVRLRLSPPYLSSCILLYGLWLLSLRPWDPFEIFDRLSFEILYAVLLSISVFLMLRSATRFAQIWSELRPLLLALERSPLRAAFSRLKGFRWSPIWNQGGQEMEWLDMARSLESIRNISNAKAISAPKNADPAKAKDAGTKWDELLDFGECKSESKNLVDNLISDAQTLYQRRFSELIFRNKDQMKDCLDANKTFLDDFQQLQMHFATTLDKAVLDLKKWWEDKRFGAVEDNRSKVDDHYLPEYARGIARIEEYVAIRYVAFIRAALAQMRQSLLFVAASFTVVLLSLNSYSFEPHQTVIWSFTGLFIVLAVVIIGILMQVYRDHLLSRITDTNPDELGKEFYFRIISVGVVPLITVLATNVPWVGQFFSSLLQSSPGVLK